jgi:phosphomannomutase
MTAVFAHDSSRPGARRVHFLPGDLLGIIVAEYLRADAVAVPISANDAVERRMLERGVSIEKTKIGSPFVVAALQALRSRGDHSRICGWEANGGFLTVTDTLLPAGNLLALPSRDAILPILANLFAAADRRSDLAALWEQLPARYGRAGLLDNVPVAVSQAILARVTPLDAEIEVEFDDSGDVLDRSRSDVLPSPLAGARAAEWRAGKAELARFFTRACGFDQIARMNVLDGLRIYFKNGDVAHIRPSGNAPQLRIYANSDSQGRANEIVELALREPNGILRQMERAFT